MPENPTGSHCAVYVVQFEHQVEAQKPPLNYLTVNFQTIRTTVTFVHRRARSANASHLASATASFQAASTATVAFSGCFGPTHISY